jgi:hypothetical protein
MNVTSTQLRLGAAAGIALIAAWFAALHTTLILAYRGGTLAQVHAMCGSSIGQFGRLLNATAAAECNSIDNTVTWWNVAGAAGLLLAVTCGAMLLYLAQHKPPADTESIPAGHQRSA